MSMALRAIFILLVMMTVAVAALADNRRAFTAALSGAEEVPPVGTDARGRMTLINRPPSRLRYTLVVNNIRDVVAAHIHCAPAGVNGPVGVTLFAGSPVTVNGELARGPILAPDIGNSCGWLNVADVAAAAAAGNAYVNVHTLANQPGEIRGQL